MTTTSSTVPDTISIPITYPEQPQKHPLVRHIPVSFPRPTGEAGVIHIPIVPAAGTVFVPPPPAGEPQPGPTNSQSTEELSDSPDVPADIHEESPGLDQSEPAGGNSEVRLMRISEIRLEADLQIRAEIDQQTVADYAERWKDGDMFPPAIVFFDSKHFLLVDGFHRVAAAKQAGLDFIAVEIRKGSRREALAAALGANIQHGLRRSNADKRRATTIALKEFADLSDRAIAEMCGVEHHLVGEVRRQLGDSPSPAPRIGRDGKRRKAQAKREPVNLRSAGSADVVAAAKPAGHSTRRSSVQGAPHSGIVEAPVLPADREQPESRVEPVLPKNCTADLIDQIQALRQSLENSEDFLNTPDQAPHALKSLAIEIDQLLSSLDVVRKRLEEVMCSRVEAVEPVTDGPQALVLM
jgi:hypothetical protein